jgi:uncharacterized protein (TIRG00374 family)
MRAGKLLVRVILSFAVSGAFIVFSLRHTDPGAVLSAIAAASPLPLIGYVGILLAVHLVRVVRWGLLLEPVGHVSFRRVNSASAVGFMLLSILPLRLGELARPLIVARPPPGGGRPLARGGALASCVVERLIDSLAIGVLGIVALRLLATTGKAADFARHASVVVTVGFAALCVALTIAFFTRERTVPLVRRTLGRISAGLGQRVARLLDNFIGGLHLGSPARVLAVLALTVVHWALHAYGFWLMATAFGLPLTALMACTVLAANVVGVMIPAGPGMVGTSQFFTQLGVSIFIPAAVTVPEVAARVAGYANSIWMLQFGQQVLLGLAFVLAGHPVSLTGLFSVSDPDEETKAVSASAG